MCKQWIPGSLFPPPTKSLGTRLVFHLRCEHPLIFAWGNTVIDLEIILSPNYIVYALVTCVCSQALAIYVNSFLFNVAT